MRCARHRARDVADFLDQVGRDIAGHIVVDEVSGRAGSVDTDDRGERFIVDPDPGAGVLGKVAVAGDHQDDGLPDVFDDPVGQRVASARPREAGVRDEEGESIAHPLRQILIREDRDQAVDLKCPAQVNVEDAGVGMRAAHEGGRVGACAQVVEEAPRAD